MADYKKYAENLIGNWERDIYAPQAQVSKDVYQTNWNALTNNYNTLKDKLARNFELAQEEYANTLNNVQNTSFNRMNAANIDLANRGLSSSGVTNRIEQADTQLKGQEVDKALASLLATNNAGVEGLYQGLNALGQGQSKLASDVAGDLGKLTDAEAANAQQYAGLLAGIGEGAAQRAASRAGSSRSKATKEEEELDEMYRRIGIAEILSSDQYTDQEKKDLLYRNFDVSAQDAIAAVDGIKNNKILDETTPIIERVQKNLNSPVLQTIGNIGKGVNTAANFLPSSLARTAVQTLNVPNSAYYYYDRFANNALQKQQDKINGLTYTNLYDLLYGEK